MQRWEYLIARVGEDSMVQDYTDDVWKPLEELGKAGWELVAVVQGSKMLFPEAYFRRQLSEVIE